jgi:hypothetical protein
MLDASFWEKVKADDMRPPTGYQIDHLIEELEHLLRSPSEHLRDKLALEIFGDWILGGLCDHDLEEIGDRLCAAMFRGLGDRGEDSVFGRSFAVIALGLVIERDNTLPRVGEEAMQRWLGALTMWWELEADLRGVVDSERGVAHAVAHGADALMAVARSRHVSTDQARVLLGSIVVRLRTSDGVALLLGEDDRLAYATMALLHRGDLTPQDLRQAIAPLSHTGRSEQRFDLNPGAYTRLNSLNWLRALYLQLRIGVQPMPWHADSSHFTRPIPGREEMLSILESTLRYYSYWFADAAS